MSGNTFGAGRPEVEESVLLVDGAKARSERTLNYLDQHYRVYGVETVSEAIS